MYWYRYIMQHGFFCSCVNVPVLNRPIPPARRSSRECMGDSSCAYTHTYIQDICKGQVWQKERQRAVVLLINVPNCYILIQRLFKDCFFTLKSPLSLLLFLQGKALPSILSVHYSVPHFEKLWDRNYSYSIYLKLIWKSYAINSRYKYTIYIKIDGLLELYTYI